MILGFRLIRYYDRKFQKYECSINVHVIFCLTIRTSPSVIDTTLARFAPGTKVLAEGWDMGMTRKNSS